jgi:hypothetical protein
MHRREQGLDARERGSRRADIDAQSPALRLIAAAGEKPPQRRVWPSLPKNGGTTITACPSPRAALRNAAVTVPGRIGTSSAAAPIKVWCNAGRFGFSGMGCEWAIGDRGFKPHALR